MINYKELKPRLDDILLPKGYLWALMHDPDTNWYTLLVSKKATRRHIYYRFIDPTVNDLCGVALQIRW